MQHSLPSTSASTHQDLANSSVTSVPPAASAAATALLGDVVRHVDVDVEATPLRSWFLHLLEPHHRPDVEWIDQVPIALAVAERRRPERTDPVGVHRVDRELDAPELRRGSVVASLWRAVSEIRRADLGVERRRAAGRMRRQQNQHPVGIADVDVGMVVRRLGDVGDRHGESRRVGERACSEVGADPAQHVTPVAQVVDRGEFLGRHLRVLHVSSEADRAVSGDAPPRNRAAVVRSCRGTLAGMATIMWEREIAEVYDATSAAMFDPDVIGPTVDRLVELADGGGALELAIGTGRVALPLSARGVTVSGIELSPHMVEVLRTKPGADAIEVTIGDMATTRVTGEFTLVYLVYNTITNVTTLDEQVAVFENAAAHLEPGGCFVVEVVVPAAAPTATRREGPGLHARDPITSASRRSTTRLVRSPGRITG